MVSYARGDLFPFILILLIYVSFEIVFTTSSSQISDSFVDDDFVQRVKTCASLLLSLEKSMRCYDHLFSHPIFDTLIDLTVQFIVITFLSVEHLICD